MENKRKFIGIWIPAHIYLSEELSVMEKFLWAEVNSLDNEKGCFASNAYFAKHLGISVRRVQQIISQLIEKGYVTTFFEQKDDTETEKRRILRVNYKEEFVKKPGEKNFTPPMKKISPPPMKNISQGGEKNFTHNNTVNNTIHKKQESVNVNSNTIAFDFSILKDNFYENYSRKPRQVEQAILQYFMQTYKDQDEARDEYAKFIAFNSERDWSTEHGVPFHNLMKILNKWVYNKKFYFADSPHY